MLKPDSTPRPRARVQSRNEEIANAVSHGVGLVALLVAAPLLLTQAGKTADATHLVGCSVFVATAALLYLGSTLYHSLPASGAKRAFRVIEHSGIYLLIAGTYTPFTLGVLRGPWGSTLLALIWVLAGVGVAFKLAGGVHWPRVSIALYIGMGWLVIVAARPMYLRMPMAGLAWMLLGGLAYTVGVAFYAAKHLRFGHLVWHLFVMAGTACHFVAVLWYSA
jgi:hemolysin III